MKKNVFLVILLSSLFSNSQNINSITYKELSVNLIDFLLQKKELNESTAAKLKTGEFTFNLRGAINNYKKENLINGIYAFSSFSSHKRAYFVIVEDKNYIILDLSTREGVDKAIKEVLDFSERQKYCYEITSDYISNIIRIYYNKNKNLLAGMDTNCEKGIKTNKNLP